MLFLDNSLVPRLGPQAALIAVAHSQLGVIWHLLTKNTPYRDLGEDYFQQLHAQRHKRNAVKKLERLGYKVILEPAA